MKLFVIGMLEGVSPWVTSCLALAAVLVVPGITGGGSAQAQPKQAKATNEFLDSIGIVTTFPDRGQPLDKTIEMINYTGFRWVRAGIEGVSDDGPTTLQTFIDLHKATGVKLNYGLVSGGSNIEKLLTGARVLAKEGALLAIEGNNEPNNWGVTYQGEKGGRDLSWMPVAKLQRDLYAAVKADPELQKYPVWHLSENGAQTDNVGLQFLEIPEGADTLMPAGTKYADAANCHNYVYHPSSPEPMDNRTWNASDPGPECKVDGLFGNYGITWGKKFQGCTRDQLETLPRVTTETGSHISEKVPEDLHGLNILNLYLAQFARGWSHTSVYLLRDRTDETGNQKYGLFNPDYTPRKAAIYLHNLTTILKDTGKLAGAPGQLDYSIANQPETMHDFLLQHSDGSFQLVIWGERLKGEDKVTLKLGQSHPSVVIYNPTIGSDPVETKANVSSIDLTLSDHPLVLVFTNK